MPQHERWCADPHCSHCYCLGRRVLDSWPITKHVKRAGYFNLGKKRVEYTYIEQVQIATGVLLEPA